MINNFFDIQEQILRVSLLKEGTKMNRRKDFSSTLPCCTNGAVCTNTNRYAQDSWAAPTREKGHCAKSFLSSRPRLHTDELLWGETTRAPYISDQNTFKSIPPPFHRWLYPPDLEWTAWNSCPRDKEGEVESVRGELPPRRSEVSVDNRVSLLL